MELVYPNDIVLPKEEKDFSEVIGVLKMQEHAPKSPMIFRVGAPKTKAEMVELTSLAFEATLMLTSEGEWYLVTGSDVEVISRDQFEERTGTNIVLRFHTHNEDSPFETPSMFDYFILDKGGDCVEVVITPQFIRRYDLPQEITPDSFHEVAKDHATFLAQKYKVDIRDFLNWFCIRLGDQFGIPTHIRPIEVSRVLIETPGLEVTVMRAMVYHCPFMLTDITEMPLEDILNLKKGKHA